MRREFVRDYAWQLTIMVVLVVGPMLLVVPFEHRPFARGLVVGAAVTTGLLGILAWVAIASGSSAVTLGGWAESWTSETLEIMRRHGYELINRGRIAHGDIDHILVGPGGLFVFETKWSAHPWQLDGDPYVAKALHQVGRQSDLVRMLLKPSIEPVRVIVLWGSAARALDSAPSRARKAPDGTVVIAGHALKDWLLGRPRNRLTADEVSDLHARLVKQTLARDQHSPLEQRSTAKVVGRCLIALLASLYLPVLAQALAGEIASGATLAVVAFAALILRSRDHWRIATSVALTVSIFWGVLVAVDLLQKGL